MSRRKWNWLFALWKKKKNETRTQQKIKESRGLLIEIDVVWTHAERFEKNVQKTHTNRLIRRKLRRFHQKCSNHHTTYKFIGLIEMDYIKFVYQFDFVWLSRALAAVFCVAKKRTNWKRKETGERRREKTTKFPSHTVRTASINNTIRLICWYVSPIHTQQFRHFNKVFIAVEMQ